MGSFIAELRRRNVFRAGALYVASAWALAQGIAQLGPVVGAPDWTTRWFIVAAAIGLPFFLAFAWIYEITPQGLKRESEVDPADSISRHTGKTLDRWIIAVLAIAVVLLLANALVSRHDATTAAATASDADSSPAAPVTDKSIAVLPFVDLSPAKDQEYFTDGISEELLSLLAKVPELRVIGRTSSFQFKGKNEDLRAIAGKLGVAHLLEGSVRKAGNRIRITTQLVRAEDGSDLWTETYDRNLDDIFSVQDEIAGEVVKALRITLLGVAPKLRQTDPEAYALFLQGRQLARLGTADALRQSEVLFERVLAIDPKYAPAWDELATNCFSAMGLGQTPDIALPLARERVGKALAIDPDYAPAHATLGTITRFSGDLAGAAAHFERALALDPGNRDVRFGSANLLISLGRLDEAIALLEYTVARDPVDAAALTSLAVAYGLAGRHDEAIPVYRTVIALAPGRNDTRFNFGITLLSKNRPEAALAESLLVPNELYRLILSGMAYHMLGRKAEADAALATLQNHHRTEASYNIAFMHALRGDPDRAFEWLDKAVEFDDPGLSEIATEPLFSRIHGDPRWLPFLRKLRMAPDQLAAIKFDVKLPAPSSVP